MNLIIPHEILVRKDIYAPSKMILAVLSETPNTTMSHVARRLRVTKATVKENMRSLRERGIITITRKGNKFTYNINDRPTV